MTGPPPQAPQATPAPKQAADQGAAPSGVAAVTDSWEARALASSLEHVVENVGLHFLGGGKEYPARELLVFQRVTDKNSVRRAEKRREPAPCAQGGPARRRALLPFVRDAGQGELP